MPFIHLFHSVPFFIIAFFSIISTTVHFLYPTLYIICTSDRSLSYSWKEITNNYHLATGNTIYSFVAFFKNYLYFFITAIILTIISTIVHCTVPNPVHNMYKWSFILFSGKKLRNNCHFATGNTIHYQSSCYFSLKFL